MGKLLLISVLLIALLSYSVFFGNRFDPGTIKDKRVLVTGASSGIGEHIAYYYSRLGARLVITARRENLLKVVAETCLKLGAKHVHVVAADMASPEDRIRVIEMTKKHLGGLDHLILNHAIIYAGWWHGTTEDFNDLQYVLQVNLLSQVDLASKSLEMLTKSRGNIGVVSSGYGEIGHERSVPYSASKFALQGFFSSLRQELRVNNTGISVTIVVLGAVDTDIMLGFATKMSSGIPTELFERKEDVAKDIVESVAKRYYKLRQGVLKYLLFFNDIFPITSEDGLSDLTLARKGTFGNFIGIYMYKFAVFLTKLF